MSAALVPRSDNIRRQWQEVFQDGNDKLILEALVNFFFMGEDCETQVVITIVHDLSAPHVCTRIGFSPQPNFARPSQTSETFVARLVLHAPFRVWNHWKSILFSRGWGTKPDRVPIVSPTTIDPAFVKRLYQELITSANVFVPGYFRAAHPLH